MSTIHVDQDINKRLVNAVNKLKASKHVIVTKKLTSHYDYGMKEPCIRDRFRISMGLTTKDIHCQVVFDSSNYYTPPDIIFDKSVIITEVFDVEEQSALLPSDDWDLANENCLYNWLEDMVSKLRRPLKSISPSPPSVSPPKKKKKNWDIFDFNDSDDDFIISNKKTGSDDDLMPVESKGKSSGRNSGHKRLARNQSDEVKDTKRLKTFEPTNNTKAYAIVDSDEEIAGSSVYSKQASKHPYIDTDIESKKEVAESSMETEKTKSLKRNPYIDKASFLDFDFDDKPKDIERLKKNPYIDGYFEPMEIAKPKVEKPNKIDLMQKKTQSTSKMAAMRLQKEKQWGEDFMTLWMAKYKPHTLKMDVGDPSSVAMYMTFKIDKTTDEWTKYCSDKKIRRLEFRTAQDMMPTERIVQPKPLAPMIVQLNLVSTHLKVKLISVVNTSEKASDGVDSIDLTYELNQEHSVGFEFTRIKKAIKKQAVHFHLFQTKLKD
ncbi:hypothetical protein HMPREF1544_08391 [Mucor circinelloides 1006PhL]|uniref:Uncharacterized protein n=1 Tax=Mucor circinelloides f. circinelloides (strain 1006PhL) TaxID=1220926 RepID=S2J3W4_MUCC1|nr:hypothetical protein HMPREF1544_08391 [Mucor circinelloides 1006PhL]